MPPVMDELLDDLRAEHADLDALVAGVDLTLPTPAEGWTVGDTVVHLWFFDREATTALTDPDRFTAGLAALLEDPDGFLARSLDEGRALGDRMPEVARETRAALLAALSAADPATKVPWYGPPMSPASFATARLMEYWAHGQDIADAIGVRREPTARLRHIAFLGVRTRGFSYAVRGMTAPEGDVHVALAAPDGSTWEWGEPTSDNRVAGPAEDFCLLVTQRRVRDDLALTATGPLADEWLSIAQCFAGLPSLPDPKRKGMRPDPVT